MNRYLLNNESEHEITPEIAAWADIKESHRIQKVLYAQAIGIERIPVGNEVYECLKLNYNGIYGYLPKTLIDHYEFKGITMFLGKVFEFVVENVDHEQQIFSANRIKALEILSSRFWKNAKEGQVFTAFIRGVGPFSVYLSIEGVPTVLRRDAFSYNFVEDLREEVEIGDSIDIKITRLVKPGQSFKKTPESQEEIAGENGFLEVSHRILQDDPWKNITHFHEKATYLGTITRVHHDHGLFIELASAPGLTVRTNFPPYSNGAILKKGDQIRVRLLEIDVQNRKIKAITLPKSPMKQGVKSNITRGLVR
jgi:small subunit ribosomal protein S1